MFSIYGTRGVHHDLTCISPTGEVRWREREFNLLPTAAINFLAQAPFGGASPINTFYLGLFDNNYVPAPEVVSSDLPLVVGEFQGYQEAQRPEWVRSYGGNTHENFASPGVFTVTATTPRTIYGGFLCSSAAKGGNSGLLLSIARYENPRPVSAGDRLEYRAALAFVSVGQP